MAGKNSRVSILGPYHQGLLLISLLLILLLNPILSELDLPGSRWILTIFFSAVLFAGIFAVSQTRGVVIAAILLAFPAFLFRWVNEFFAISDILYHLFDIFFIFYIGATILSYVLKSGRVTTGRIVGAVNVYFLIGLTWSHFYSIIYALSPASFAVTSPDPSYFLYYSYVTMSTLGYGDITPLTPVARSFAYMEAMIGQLFLAVLVARLVGQHIVDAGRKSTGSFR